MLYMWTMKQHIFTYEPKTAEHDIEAYVHASFLINLGSPTKSTYENLHESLHENLYES